MTHWRKKIVFGEVLLASTIFASAGFVYWLIAETEAEKATNFYEQYKRLVLKDEVKKAQKLHKEVLTAGGDSPLNEIWLPLVQAQEDGYDKLSYYVRILAGNPEREATYEEIAELISNSPPSFNEELKDIYLKELYEVPNIRRDYIKKFGLKIE